jgi:Tfp pilus assembly protein PilF
MARISIDKKNAMSGRAYLTRYQEVAALNAEGLWIGIQVERELGDFVKVRDYENRLHRHFPDSQELQLLIESQKKEQKNSEVKAVEK